MSCVPYSSVVDNLIYAMVYARLDITHAVGVLRRFMLKMEKENYNSEADFQVFSCHK